MKSEKPTLRAYQRDCLNAVADARADSINRLLVKMPTGTGKTVVFAAMPEWDPIRQWLEQFDENQRHMLVIAHREELLDQAADKIAAANPHLHISIEQGDRYASPMSDVVIASIQTLAASGFKRLDRLMKRHTFRLVIVDEAHHASANTYRGALSRLGFLPPPEVDVDEIDEATQDEADEAAVGLEAWDAVAPRDRLLVGVTATPNRSDSIGLGCVFQRIVYSYDLKQAIQDTHLVPIVPWVVETRTSIDDVSLSRGEFNQRELADAVNNTNRNKLTVASYLEKGLGRQALTFSVDVAHAEALAQEYQLAGVTTAVISGKTPKDTRRNILSEFRRGRIDMLSNCMVLTEGTDLPMVSCIVQAKPTKSGLLYEQMLGRGLRPNGAGKLDCILIDIVDIARRHSLQTAASLWGLPPNLKPNGKKLDELEAEWDAFKEEFPHLTLTGMKPMTLEEMRATVKTFDIWSVPKMGALAEGLSMNWTPAMDMSSFRLTYPWLDSKETIVVSSDLLGKWVAKVTTYVKGPDGKSAAGLISVVGSDFRDAQKAMRAAETFVLRERRSSARIVAAGVAWRSNPASEKQLAALRRMRAPVRPNMTSGEASDMINAGSNQRRP